ncbi:HNH endonuclease (plasmid) [Streptomyces sp. NBC_00513]|uniref:HNH endonuclease n=1 Tax=unclassified Streptomyces TaxID=2593676 RepID=UPI002254881C|nr:HNH endonuclease [Streptomyces sp. NBC_00424]MCX5078819.1 HNH endonuclease [Streptomyces sp. NBC_00424]WUD46261.1 HNH endonuclease [Streptomyces sp. NBC_00513]
MIPPDRPPFGVKEVVEACSDWLEKHDPAKRLHGHLYAIRSLEHTYHMAGQRGILLSLLRVERVIQSDHADRELFERAYGEAVVGRVAGRRLYEALKALAAHTRCPLCGIQAVAQVDHHAPKDKFPFLALTPLNLIAVCGTCNQLKSNTFEEDATREAVHPYFDKFGNDRWLHAQIDAAANGVAVYQAIPPATWPSTKALRVRRHFDKYNLSLRYKAEASHALARRKRADTRTFKEAGSAELRSLLSKEAEDQAAYDPNCWQAAFLSALADSNWYLNGGMQSI